LLLGRPLNNGLATGIRANRPACMHGNKKTRAIANLRRLRRGAICAATSPATRVHGPNRRARKASGAADALR
jgi:hypothetical protein